MATPGGPRPGNFPPGYNPNALANNMQNLQINQPNQQQSSNLGGSAPRLPNASPFGQQPPPFTGSRPGPPPPGVFPRGPMPPSAPAQTTLPPNMVYSRPSGQPPVSQPPPFASRPPPPGAIPSSIGGPAAPPHSGTGPRPGPFPSSPMTSGPTTPTQMSTSGPVSNGPPAFATGTTQGGTRFPHAMGSMPRPLAGPPQSPTMLSSGQSSQPLQMRPSFGSPPAGASSAMGQPAPPFSARSQAPQFSAPPQAPPFSASPQNMPPPPPGSSPFSAPVPGMLQSSGSPYGMQSWPPQPQQVNFSIMHFSFCDTACLLKNSLVLIV